MFPLLIFGWLMLQYSTALAIERDPLTAALEAARQNPQAPFELRVDCTDEEGRRSLRVIRGSVAVWGNERQLRLTDNERDRLLDTLLDADFAEFDARYGETRKAEKQEAPLRVSCRVLVALEGLEKSSVQIMDGKQSEKLLGLAQSLLDLIEPRAAAGIAADSVEDGLAKLASGTLAPEVLELRMVTLPDAGTDAAGSILRIEGGRISRQAYTPGRTVGDVRSSELSPADFCLVLDALQDAAFQELPINLAADSFTEIELGILGRRKTVVARSTFRPAAAGQQAAFTDMLALLGTLPTAPDR